MGELKGEGALAPFHDLIREWFRDEVGTPTDAQAMAWPVIAAGEHVLVSAPTGSGKTLTAFLWALDRLLTGAWSSERTRVLYVSPLKALNTDVRRNLEKPLAALRERFETAGVEVPRVTVATRSGDTPQSERRKMIRRPPEILVTTPESLNILLTSKSGRLILQDLEAVILDEIHALVGQKRGTHLITAVDRLVHLSGEFQRIALSATVRPMEAVAEFVGGREITALGEGGEAVYRPRPVRVLRSTATKVYDVSVRFPAAPDPDVGERDEDAIWEILAKDFRRVIGSNRSTLLFANSRRLTEKVTRLVNLGAHDELCYSHHGSLSREVRSVVEQRLKDGQLRAIVATNSLELGIDIGDLDEVILIQAPRSVSSAVQRVGRAGHGVGQTSRGLFYPTHGRDLVESAVLARAVVEQDIEELRPVEGALDVLAQVLLSLCVAETWDVDELFARVRASWPYRRLPRAQFDRVLDMLAGRYADARIRELRPRVRLDRVRGTVTARPGVERLIYMAGGTIADRGYYALRHFETMAKIGDLDEEFVWERGVGDTFTLGAQVWQVQRITHNDVLVRPGRGAAAMPPFWRADAQDRDHELCQKLAAFLERAGARLGDEKTDETTTAEKTTVAFREELAETWRLEPEAIAALLDFLEEQRLATGGPLPRTDRLLVERAGGRFGEAGHGQMIVHNYWGGTVNRPLALAIQAAWEERHPDPIEIFHDDTCLLARVDEDVSPAELFALVPPEHVEDLLRRRLESTGFFGARFRWAAGTSLLLPRASFRQRLPLWVARQRSKKLLDGVREHGDFPVVQEAWRTCLRDEFDLDTLKRLLARVQEGDLPFEEVRTERPSPLAAGLVWQYTNQFMYETDAPGPGAGGAALRQDVLQELVHASHLRPRLPAALGERLRRKLQRLEVGYAPAPGDELALWLEERVLLPETEWTELVDAVLRDHGEDGDEVSELDADQVVASVAERALFVTPPGASIRSIASAESLARLVEALDAPVDAFDPRPLGESDGHGARERVERLLETQADEESAPDASRLAGEWLRFYGPIASSRGAAVFGLDEAAWSRAVDELTDAGTVVVDELTEGAQSTEICDAENLEILLRWLRADQRPSFEARPAVELPLFLALHQGVAERGDGLEDLQERLEQLFGLALPASLWEQEILPARLDPYYPAWLDSAMQQSDLLWVGTGREKVAFGFESDRELFEEVGADGSPEGSSGDDSEEADERAEDDATLDSFFPDGAGRYEIHELAEQVGREVGAVNDRLWDLAWKGRVTCDAWLAVRQGLQNQFQPIAATAPARPSSRSRRGRGARRFSSRAGRGWRASKPFGGRWYALEERDDELDALEREELTKDRVRLLLSRYGIVFRQLLQRELPAFGWSKVFRTLRLMELSGEIVAGQFFRGVRGLQFAAHGAFKSLVRGLPRDVVYWLSAADPASLCGVEVEGLKADLPSRLPTTHLVYHGTELVLVSKRRGKDLDFRVAADHPRLVDYLAPLEHLLTREVQPLSSIPVETIDGEPASASEIARRLETVFRVTREGDVLRLWKRY